MSRRISLAALAATWGACQARPIGLVCRCVEAKRTTAIDRGD